jgi:hypothetical protein
MVGPVRPDILTKNLGPSTEKASNSCTGRSILAGGETQDQGATGTALY